MKAKVSNLQDLPSILTWETRVKLLICIYIRGVRTEIMKKRTNTLEERTKEIVRIEQLKLI